MVFECAIYLLPTIGQRQTSQSKVWGMITAKINVCVVAKHFPQVSLRDKRRGLNRAVLNYPDQLATRVLETTTTCEGLHVTRLTCNSNVSFRNRSDCWLQWPSQCSRLWSQCLFISVWISWKSIHHRMSVSNGWILYLKISFLLSIGVDRKRTRLSSHFYPAFRLLKRRRKKQEWITLNAFRPTG